MDKLNKTIFYPFLFGIYPVLFLVSSNIEQTPVHASFRSILISISVVIIGYIFVYAFTQNKYRSGLITTLLTGLFYSYGHFYNFFEDVHISSVYLGRHRYFIPLWIGLFVFGLWGITKKISNPQSLTKTFNVIAICAIIFPVIKIGSYQTQTLILAKEASTEHANSPELSLPVNHPAPDIYYIILDGYSGSSVLEKYYQFDNSPFLKSLEGLGFQIGDCSQSNYSQTQLSLASSLNLSYIDSLGRQYTAGKTSRVGLSELIKHNATRQALENLGYKTIAFDSGYDATRIEDSDIYLSPNIVQKTNDFETLFLRTTAARILSEGWTLLNIPPDWEARDRAHRERVLFTLDQLQNIWQLEGPKFVFAHIISPHWPHVFGPNGEQVHEHPDSVSGYRNQVIFINNKLLPIIKDIIINSDTPPIIILQADHGAVIEDPVTRMSIFNALLLPYGGEELFYRSISPVNIFRLIFNIYFNSDNNLLEDISYYSTYDEPYDYTIVTVDSLNCQVK